MWDALQDPSVAAALVREAPDMIVTFDPDGRFLEANPATIRLSGYSLEELRELPIASFFSGADLARLGAARERTAEGEQVSVTVRYRRKDGELRWLSARTAPLVKGGAPTGMLVFARDVTDEMVRTQALRESDQRFRSLVSAFDRAFFVVDPDGRIAGLFGRWVRSAGLEPQRFLGKTPAEILPATGGEPHTSVLARAIAGEDVTYECGYTLPTTGEERHLRINASPMRDTDGRVIGVAGVAADITQRLRAEAESAVLRARVAEAERTEALGKLVSGVAHELNNPLAAVLNFTEELLLSEPDPDRHAALEVVRAQALRSRVIVRDLLTFSRRGGHRPLSPQAPGPIIEAVVQALRPGLGNGVTLTERIAEGFTPIELDRAGLEQVVTNLIANAAQAARRRGHVWLDAARRGDVYEIAVRDDGPGIPADVLPRLFEPFFTTKTTGQGVGLGLAVSLGIVRDHGGTLEATNLPEGAGACFTVRLPVSARAVSLATPPIGLVAVPRPRVSTPSPDAPGLLIVDDEEPIRRALRRFFERRGWRVDDAADGLEGLALLRAPDAASRYVAVLCDLRMPGLNGPELYARVREEAPELLPRIIISTGDVTGVEAARFLAGISAPVLEKPFELTEVEALLNGMREALRPSGT